MSMGLVDALASGGAAARGAHQREVDEAAIAANKQATELQGLQLATGKMQLQEAQNQQALQKALEQGYRDWTSRQAGAEDRDTTARKQYELDATTYAGKVGDASNWQGDKGIGLGDVGPVPKEPEPTKQGRASLFSHLADIAARTPGGMKAAEELRKSHKAAEEEGMLEATKFALRGEDPEKVIGAFNEYGTNKLIPGSGRVENGIYYAKDRSGKEVDLDPKKWGVVFGLTKPDEYKIEGGYKLNTKTGAHVRLEGPPKDNILVLKGVDGEETAYDLRTGQPMNDPKRAGGLSRNVQKDIGDAVLKGLGANDFSGLDEANSARYFTMRNMAEYLIARGAIEPGTGAPMTAANAAAIAFQLTDPKTPLQPSDQKKRLDRYIPEDPSRAVTAGREAPNAGVDLSTATLADLRKVNPILAQKLESVRDNPKMLEDFNQHYGVPGAAQRLLGSAPMPGGAQSSGAFTKGLPDPSSVDETSTPLPNRVSPTPGQPRPTAAPAPKLDPAKLASYKPGELAYFASRTDLPEADQRAIVQEAERRGMRATKNLTGGYTLKEVVGQPAKPAAPAAPSEVPGLQSAPPIAPAPTAAPAAAPKPAAPKGDANGMIEKGSIDLTKRAVVKNKDGSVSAERSITITEGGVAVLIPTVVGGKVVSDREAVAHYRKTGQHLGKFASVEQADKAAKEIHLQQEKRYAGGKKPGLQDAPNAYEADRRQAGRKPTATEEPAATATETARKQASRAAAGRLQAGDIQWFIDNWDLLEPGTQKIYSDAINRRLQEGPMGQYPKGSRFNSNTR